MFPTVDVAHRLAWLVGVSLTGNPILKLLALDGLDPKATARAMRRIDWELVQCKQSCSGARSLVSLKWTRWAAVELWREWRAWRICCFGAARPFLAMHSPFTEAPGPCA